MPELTHTHANDGTIPLTLVRVSQTDCPKATGRPKGKTERLLPYNTVKIGKEIIYFFIGDTCINYEFLKKTNEALKIAATFDALNLTEIKKEDLESYEKTYEEFMTLLTVTNDEYFLVKEVMNANGKKHMAQVLLALNEIKQKMEDLIDAT
jgi:cell fate (sporulation/competence/biofilm development) regulator YlbF (YheA/YmcA/DUF963 family)